MAWCSNEPSDGHGHERSNINRMIINQQDISNHDHHDHDLILSNTKFQTSTSTDTNIADEFRSITCPSCGHIIEFQDQQAGIHDLPGLPAGVKFDPTDQEILEHLEAKVLLDSRKLHPLIDEFIPTLEGENGICYTHPERLPGVNKDGQIRHFFHRPSKAYTTGTRKRRKVHTADEDGSETRWHKTGKTRPVLVGGEVKGFKKILVLYTNYGRQRKPEKTNWVMHQYHLGNNEEEKDGELVVSKVFYQTQPRQCGGSSIKEIALDPSTINMRSSSGLLMDHSSSTSHHRHHHQAKKPNTLHDHVEFYNPNSFLSYDNIDHHDHGSHINRENPPQLIIPNLVVPGDASSFIHRLTTDASKQRKS